MMADFVIFISKQKHIYFLHCLLKLHLKSVSVNWSYGLIKSNVVCLAKTPPLVQAVNHNFTWYICFMHKWRFLKSYTFFILYYFCFHPRKMRYIWNVWMSIISLARISSKCNVKLDKWFSLGWIHYSNFYKERKLHLRL